MKTKKKPKRIVLGMGRLWTDQTRFGLELHKKCKSPDDCPNELVPMYPCKAHGKLVRIVAEVLE